MLKAQACHTCKNQGGRRNGYLVYAECTTVAPRGHNKKSATMFHATSSSMKNNNLTIKRNLNMTILTCPKQAILSPDQSPPPPLPPQLFIHSHARHEISMVWNSPRTPPPLPSYFVTHPNCRTHWFQTMVSRIWCPSTHTGTRLTPGKSLKKHTERT